MNKTAILVSCIVGVVTGVVLILLLRIPSANLCCCADPAVLMFGTLIGAMLGPMFYRIVPSTKLNLGLGAVHGITVSAFAVFTLWIIISVFTSPETVTEIAGRYVDQFEKQLEETKKQLEKQEDAKTEDIDKMQEQLAEPLEMMRSDAKYPRRIVIMATVIHTLLIAPLLGLLGAWLGLSIFRSTIAARGGGDGEGGDPDRSDSDRKDPDRMEPPQQQKPWWEETQ